MRKIKINKDKNFKEYIIDRFKYFQINLSKNIIIKTRKIINYI